MLGKTIIKLLLGLNCRKMALFTKHLENPRKAFGPVQSPDKMWKLVGTRSTE